MRFNGLISDTESEEELYIKLKNTGFSIRQEYNQLRMFVAHIELISFYGETSQGTIDYDKFRFRPSSSLMLRTDGHMVELKSITPKQINTTNKLLMILLHNSRMK